MHARLYLLIRSDGGVSAEELPVVQYKGPTGHAYRALYTSAAGGAIRSEGAKLKVVLER